MSRLFPLFLLIVVGTLVLLSLHGRGADPSVLLDAGMTLASLAGLAGILGQPWDLYFEARGLAVDQEESLRRGLGIPPEEVEFARASARKLLLLCLALHAGAACLVSLATFASGGRLGYYFAAFFLVSTVFRPMGAFYAHMKHRLVELRTRARLPREDALELRTRVERLELGASEWSEARRALEEKLNVEMADLEARQRETQRDLSDQHARYEAKVDQLTREFARSIEKLTDDRELLRGMRAFVRMVKEA